MASAAWLFQRPDARRGRAASSLLSVALHGGAAALLFTLTPAGENRKAHPAVALVTPLLAPYLPAAAPAPGPDKGGGGGGGGRAALPASRGRLPRVAPRQFTPPAAVIENEAPKLAMEPTIVIAPEVQLPRVDMAIFGDPLARIGPPSNGTGSGGGIGSGSGGGVGQGKGSGYGPGEGGGYGGGTRGARGGLTSAAVLYSVEPEYTDEARKARLQGVVAVVVEIDEAGRARNANVRSGLGLGLDERAVAAVMKWRFRPYRRDGVPVAGLALIEVHFRLL